MLPENCHLPRRLLLLPNYILSSHFVFMNYGRAAPSPLNLIKRSAFRHKNLNGVISLKTAIGLYGEGGRPTRLAGKNLGWYRRDWTKIHPSGRTGIFSSYYYPGNRSPKKSDGKIYCLSGRCGNPASPPILQLKLTPFLNGSLRISSRSSTFFPTI